MPHYINIALPLPTKRQFTYMLEDTLPLPALGTRALVPFGKNTYTGIVVETNVPPMKEARYVIEILDDTPVFTKNILDLTKWIADYYFASWGETLSAALPQGMSPQSVVTVRLLKHLDDQELQYIAQKAPKRAALLALLTEHKGPLSVSYLQQQLHTDTVAAQLEALENAGMIEIVRSLEQETQPKIQKAISISWDLMSDNDRLQNVLNDLDVNAPKQSLLLSTLYLHAMHHGEPMLLTQALQEARTGAKTAESLIEKGYATESLVEVQRHYESKAEEDALRTHDETEFPLTEEQEHAVTKIVEALRLAKPKTFLLHGVTGSGKTLVYMHAIRQTLAQGKSALMLVPEISLTPQLIDRYRATFGNSIAVLHSRMNTGERYDAWRAIRRGEVRLVLGVRSALFAPLNDLGLIVVDEEHESSYKQESPSPRYNARDCSVIRGIMENAIVVLGSATPSLESTYNAQTGKYHLLEITKRADNAVLPDIKVVDMLDARKRKQMKGSFSFQLLEDIILRLDKKEGIILLQNRRGFAPRLECDECGHIPQCYQCNVSLTYHKHRDQLRCHYCGWTVPAQLQCKVCGNPEMKDIGTGTQRVEDELNELLKERGKEAVIQRVDLDTTTKKGSFRKILQAFQSGEIDIMVGTQMIAKGLDLSRVTFVGVINADLQLYLPDFRSAERTFQLLTQVAGRAGRSGERRGEVLIQTAHPQHQAVISAKLGQYDIFYHDELQQRRDAQYPPFTRFVLVELSGRDQEQVHQHAHYFAKYLPRHHNAVHVLGPSKPNVDRLRGQYRRIIAVKGIKSEDPSGNILRHALSMAFSAYHDNHATSAVRVLIDIDSYSVV